MAQQRSGRAPGPGEASEAGAAGKPGTLADRVAQLERENRSLRIAVAELERISERDTLTPLYNRRYFVNALNDRIARAGRYGEQAMLVYVDVNGLKAINDRLGHAAGDFALVEVAQRLAVNVRSTDVVARLGGDEFGLILDKADAASATDKIAALGEALGAECHFDAQPLPLSAAFGMAAIVAESGADTLMIAADRDMYRGKGGEPR